ncbi:hypothetical protein BH23THE1_BH23THE1_32480 [soil metagenome]
MTSEALPQYQRSDIEIPQNPFLDPFASHPETRVAALGQPLSRIFIPPIKTLIFKTADNSGNLAAVNVNDALSRAGITPQQPILVSDENIGIELNLNLFGGSSNVNETPSQVTPAEVQSGQVVGTIIPTTYREAKSVLHLITAQRTGSRNVAFNITELKRIAKNLDLQASGNKDVLANRIRTAIIGFFNLPSQ